mmetsp:Transcript_14517/g.13121  ORF Transcript_14517/g.13121 Transcript_14517/m.13121 type:complete len:113 (+) Transcript_14517:3-341(+)
MISIWIVILILLYIVSVLCVQGEIKTCPACKLNRLPEVRRFIKEPGNADSYENLKITFIPGHNPDLYILDDKGGIVEKIDLTSLTSQELHKLLESKGFERKAKGATKAISTS